MRERVDVRLDSYRRQEKNESHIKITCSMMDWVVLRNELPYFIFTIIRLPLFIRIRCPFHNHITTTCFFLTAPTRISSATPSASTSRTTLRIITPPTLLRFFTTPSTHIVHPTCLVLTSTRCSCPPTTNARTCPLSSGSSPKHSRRSNTPVYSFFSWLLFVSAKRCFCQDRATQLYYCLLLIVVIATLTTRSLSLTTTVLTAHWRSPSSFKRSMARTEL